MESNESKRAAVEAYLKTMPEGQLDELLSVVSDLRVAKYQNPRLKFKKDQPKQMEFIGNSHIINIALCGNQWGKSFAMAYKIAAIATGEDSTAPHQPDPTRELKILVVGPSWSKISETVQKDLTSLLRGDEWEIGVRKGSYIGKIIIHGPKKSKTEVLFMPSSTDKQEDSQEFEGSKFHYAFVDEGIKPDLFRKILVRLGSSDGRFYQAFTRLPDTLHLAYHLIDLEKGKGEFKYLIDKGWVNIVAASNIENKYLDKRQKEMLAAGAGTGKDMELYDKLVPVWTSEDPDDKKLKEELLEQMTDNFKARIFGIVDRPTGAVFNFREEINGKNYNMIGFDELTKIWQTEEGRWDLDHDYGQADPATWKLIWTSRKTGTSYFVDEVYRAGMSHQQSCEELYEMLHRWKCYNTVRFCFADKQIRDTGRRDKRTDVDITIEQQYKAKRMPNGDPCIPPHVQFICKQSDKNNFSHTLSMVQSLVEEENPLTPGLPYFRFTYLVENCVRELKTLRWNPRDPKSTNSRVEETLGDNHCIDPMRYFANNKVNIAMWEERYKLKEKFNELAYEVGGSGNMVFNI